MGKVYLVGAGPGAPDLLTLRAAEILERAEWVFHDALVHPQTLALAARARKILVGKRSGRHSTAQSFINKRLVDAARKHAVVVRLKGGDPMLFGRAQEEIDALRKAGIDFEIVPGVTAATAVSAELGVSLTRRGLARHVVFVTPRAGMGAGLAEEISAELIARGKPEATPLVLVESATLPEQRILRGTLADLPALALGGGGGPAVVLLGEVLGAARAEAVLAEKIEAILKRA